MRKLRAQLKLALSKDYSNTQVCSSFFTAMYGRFCKYYLHHKITQPYDSKDNENAVFIIKLSMINQHWLRCRV
jgi:hypothetical protein